MITADIWFHDQLVATLTRNGDATTFSYLDSYLSTATHPIAATLPLESTPLITRGGAVPAFFAGLLPEGRRLSSVKKLIKASADDELALLISVGNDPVGAVSIVPHGQKPHSPQPGLDLLNTSDFSHAMTDAGIADPIALPGVQDKASARTIAVPFGSDAILKLSPPEYPHLVENEHACYQLLQKNALRIATSQVKILKDIHHRSGLLVTRFDRYLRADGTLGKFAVEDAAQMLGLWPAEKYDPSYEDIAHRLHNITITPMLSLRNLAFQIAYAWLTGNGDLHAKNISVINRGRGYEMSPIYDVPSTLPYGDDSLGLTIQGRTTGISAKIFQAFCSDIGLPEKVTVSIIKAALEASAGIAPALIQACDYNSRQQRDLIRVLRKRRVSWE